VPIQKIGVECPSSPTIRATWSTQVPFRTADRMPRGDAEPCADDRRQRGELQCRGEYPGEIARHLVLGDVRLAEVQSHDIGKVGAELHIDRPVQPHLLVDTIIGRLIGLIADHGDDRVRRDHPADDEGDDQKAQQRRRDHRERRGKFTPGGQQFFAARASRFCGL
jgi:hypothetical protein